MNENKHPGKKPKWEYRSSPLALKILLIVLIALSIVVLMALRQVHLAIRNYTGEIQQEVSDLEYANQDMKDKVKDPNAAQNIKDVAREELGLVDPNTIIIEPDVPVPPNTETIE